MTQPVLIRDLQPGAAFVHVSDEGTSDPQPERVFRLIELRASTAIVENGLGVRTSWSKKTQVLPVAEEAWENAERRKAG